MTFVDGLDLRKGNDIEYKEKQEESKSHFT